MFAASAPSMQLLQKNQLSKSHLLRSVAVHKMGQGGGWVGYSVSEGHKGYWGFGESGVLESSVRAAAWGGVG